MAETTSNYILKVEGDVERLFTSDIKAYADLNPLVF